MMGAAAIANDMMCRMCFDYTDQQITLDAKQLGSRFTTLESCINVLICSTPPAILHRKVGKLVLHIHYAADQCELSALCYKQRDPTQSVATRNVGFLDYYPLLTGLSWS